MSWCTGGFQSWNLGVVEPDWENGKKLLELMEPEEVVTLTWFVRTEQVFAKSFTAAVELFGIVGAELFVSLVADGCKVDTFFHRAEIACICNCWIFRSFSNATLVVSMSWVSFLWEKKRKINSKNPSAANRSAQLTQCSPESAGSAIWLQCLSCSVVPYSRARSSELQWQTLRSACC